MIQENQSMNIFPRQCNLSCVKILNENLRTVLAGSEL